MKFFRLSLCARIKHTPLLTYYGANSLFYRCVTLYSVIQYYTY